MTDQPRYAPGEQPVHAYLDDIDRRLRALEQRLTGHPTPTGDEWSDPYRRGRQPGPPYPTVPLSVSEG